MGQRTVQYQNVFKVDPFESRLIDYRTIEDRKFQRVPWRSLCKPVSYPLSPKPVPEITLETLSNLKIYELPF